MDFDGETHNTAPTAASSGADLNGAAALDAASSCASGFPGWRFAVFARPESKGRQGRRSGLGT